MADDKKTAPSFEEALSELESLVVKLEQGELTLDESLKAFERGVELTRTCQQALREAELKIDMLTEKSTEAKLEPFDNDE